MVESISSAVEDFRRARRRATLEAIMARIRGKPVDLLSYEDVRRKLKATTGSGQQLQDIPLDAIVGSVGRYQDFTRTFLPRYDEDVERWARVKLATTDQAGLPPIEVYQIGNAYFVLDGNHRVSVARQLGATHIQAYVIPVHTRVPLSPDVRPDDLIVKAEYADFLEKTHLDELRPGADLSVTIPGQYRLLEEHIQVHRYFMGLEQQREIPYEEAVAHWYDTVYMPVVKIIRAYGLLRDFPDRTETDLYLWLAEHRAVLEKELGWDVRPETAAADMAARQKSAPQRVLTQLLDAVIPNGLEPGPPPGQWRRERMVSDLSGRMFADIVVAINGEPAGWAALDHAIYTARHEGGRVLGLHVVPTEAELETPDVEALRNEFEHRCSEAGVEGKLAIEVGNVPQRICDRARWGDLVIVSISYPPAPQPIARLGSGITQIIRRCPRPLLTVPHLPPRLEQALLAYDGSPKAEEALFITTYLAGRWGISLTVMGVQEGNRSPSAVLERARNYLEERQIEAAYVEEVEPVAEAIVRVSEAHGCDLVLMGGYGSAPILEVVLGSVVDEVLRTTRRPVLICR